MRHRGQQRRQGGYIRAVVALLAALVMTFSLSSGLVRGAEVELEKQEGAFAVKMDGELFARYVFEGHPKPFVYPIIGPTGQKMTRDYPMKEQANEAHDHPHHKSMWFAQDKVNGVRFWKEEGRIVQDDVLSVSSRDGEAALRTRNKWVGPDGDVKCTDTRTVKFSSLPGGARAIDWKVTLHASHGKLTIGDTKEGTMAIRTHPNLRLKNDPPQVTTANGKAINSQGVRGKPVWGKRASWLDYWGEIDDETVGVGIFDHPSNPRHPTWWHARHYGLIAANPFGLQYFENKSGGAGKMEIPAGESVTFRYRFVFHRGSYKEADIAELYRRYATQPRNIPSDYELAYWQPFDDKSALDQFRFSDPSMWSYAASRMNGCLQSEGDSSYEPPVRSPRIMAMLSDRTFGDFVLEAEVKYTGKDYGHADQCLFFGFQDPSHYYYTHIANNMDNHAHNIFIVDGEPRTKISTKTTEGIDWMDREWHDVRVERDASEGSIKVYFDDMNTPVMRAEDTTFRRGHVGFGTFDDQGMVDNVRIWSPDMKKESMEYLEAK